MRNAIYGRQSIDKKDSVSVETQIEKARAECDPNDIITVYTDRGYSGKNTNRPEFQRLMSDVRKNMIDRIIVYKLDRFSRSILDFVTIWDILSKHDVEFLSVNERFDTSTPIGKAMLYITIVFAQMERETIAERVTDNYYKRAKLGSWLGGPAPYGFEIGRLLLNDKKIPTLIKSDEMDIVLRSFYMYAQDEYSLGGISKYLTEVLKVPGPHRETWNNVSLARIFRNPAYVIADMKVYLYYKNLGVHIVNDPQEFTGEHAAMLIGKRGASTRKRKQIQEATLVLTNWEGHVSSDIWLKCQYRLEKNEQIKNTGKGKYTWLSGLMKCGHCGRSFRVIVDKKYPDVKKIYCTGRIDKICTYLSKWHVEDIEAYVQRELCDMLDACSNEPVIEEPVIDNAEQIRLHEISQKLENLAANLTNQKISDITAKLINQEAEKLTKEYQEILKEIQEKSKPAVKHYEKIDFARLDIEGKKIVVRNYIKQVDITDEEIVIMWLV